MRVTEEKNMFTVSEVAKIKDVSVHAVRAAIRAKHLKAVMVGSVWIVMKEDIDSYVPKPYGKKRRVKRFVIP